MTSKLERDRNRDVLTALPEQVVRVEITGRSVISLDAERLRRGLPDPETVAAQARLAEQVQRDVANAVQNGSELTQTHSATVTDLATHRQQIDLDREAEVARLTSSDATFAELEAAADMAQVFQFPQQPGASEPAPFGKVA